MYIDENNILSITQPTEKNKKYTQIVENFPITSFDKKVLAYHKKQIKQINFKDLGDKMGLFFVIARSETTWQSTKFQTDFSKGFSLFKGFDEETGKSYYFYPKFNTNNLDNINYKLSKLKTNIKLKKTDKGIISYDTLNEGEIENYYSFLYALTLLYGKLDIKNGNLNSIKIHIPLFGSYLSLKDMFDEIISKLQKDGIFLSKDIIPNNNGETYQISSNDYELLQIFANFHKNIENIDQIIKQEQTNKIKEELIEYIKYNKLDKDGIIETLENSTIKLLVK